MKIERKGACLFPVGLQERTEIELMQHSPKIGQTDDAWLRFPDWFGAIAAGPYAPVDPFDGE
jgi:hypothetical protein